MRDEDFEKVQIESTHSVEITDFVEQAQINPKFFYKPYFLEPQKGGEKAYALLHKALTTSGKVGVAKVAIQKREYLAAVKPDGLFLILELMHFAQEVLEPASLNNGADRAVSPQELKMATALIDAMTTEWEPTKYKDQYQTALMQLIEEKAQKRAPTPKPAAPRVQPNVIDMVAVLQQSLQRAGLKQKASNGRTASPKSTSALVKRRRRSVAA